jgi:hypothetical protein
MMIIHESKPLFAWDCLEDSPSLKTVRELLAALPDGKLLQSLRTARGKGRDDYPVSVLWGLVVLRVALRHITTEAVLAELRRNEGLRRLIGIESEEEVPKKWNVSRFEDVLGQEPHRTLLKDVFNVLIQRLGIEVAELGSQEFRHPQIRRKSRVSRKAVKAWEDESPHHHELVAQRDWLERQPGTGTP